MYSECRLVNVLFGVNCWLSELGLVNVWIVVY